jgi:hypothetical protein
VPDLLAALLHPTNGAFDDLQHLISPGEHVALFTASPLDVLGGSQRNSEAKNYCRSSVSAAMPKSDFHKEGFFRRCATVFKISRESSSSDTARAMLMAPTIAQ